MIAYLLYIVLATGWIYPVATHWAWSGQGWLSAYLEYTVRLSLSLSLARSVRVSRLDNRPNERRTLLARESCTSSEALVHWSAQ